MIFVKHPHPRNNEELIHVVDEKRIAYGGGEDLASPLTVRLTFFATPIAASGWG